MNFDTAIEIVLKHEGGFVNHPSDPGGATNFGITERVARQHGYLGQMQDIPMQLVRNIYRKDYWNACRCDDLPGALRLPVFDFAVNSGVSRAIRTLQTVLGVTADGVFGPRTLDALQQVDSRRLAYHLCLSRLDFLTALGHFSTFARGWVRRVTDIMRHIS
jgi:lysozyme family protein